MKQSTMKAKVTLVTPGMAKRMLEDSPNFRPLSDTHVRWLADQMSRGLWDENGESIKLDKKHKLVDGQHRLAACVMSGVSFRTVLAEGVGPHMHIDTGKRRRPGDFLTHLGYKNGGDLAAGARLYIKYHMVKDGPPIHEGGDAHSIAIHDIVNTVKRNKDMEASTVHAKRTSKYIPRGVGTFVHYMASRIDPVAADVFFDGLANGAGLTENDPILHLRHRMVVNSTAKRKMDRAEVLAITIKAWNLWNAGRPCRVLKWRAVGIKQEAFPRFEEED